MFWNLENYFDWKQDTMFVRQHWSKRKFMVKSRAIAKAVLWIADEEGRLPDAIGVAEVENRFVLERLVRDTPLSKAGYGIIHFDSPDPRGIDVALLYRKATLKLLRAVPMKIENRSGPPMKTRDILLADFVRADGDSVAFLVNHHPSKYGGSSSSRRMLAMERLREITDSLFSEGWSDVVSMGDFNDTPESTEEYSKIMVNLAVPLASKGRGTIKYSGKWEMIDMFFISPSLADRNPGVGMKVEKIPFLMVRDNAHSGEKPFRTFSGPTYSGGVSDHCPIALMIQ
jgi:endonuclease/exonuclease/phosphatase family metal-dependent hydrolase